MLAALMNDALLNRLHELRDLSGVINLATWDQETYMPRKAEGSRAAQLGTLQGLYHERLVDPRVGEWLAEAKAATPDEVAMLRVFQRERDRAAKLPSRLVKAIAEAQSLALGAWRDARTQQSFPVFAPKLDVLVNLRREQADALGHDGERYDALLEGYEPGMRVARLTPVMEEPILWRRNREPFITVQSQIRPGVQAPDVTAAALPVLEPFVAALPVGYRMEVSGAAGESAKANASLLALFPVMVAVMVTLLMIQLRSLGSMALVMATAPLGIPGAAAALLIMDAPFGFVALLGVIALAGMVMRNTLILVDQVQQDQAAGLPLREAIIESTVRRARPVILTALAAIFAFIPLTTSVFWGPMAIAMIGGLLVGTVATLVVVPAMHALALGRDRPASPAAPTPQAAVLEPAE
jgi:preprotein translocase subunit SecF